jgi:hypothetical protein
MRAKVDSNLIENHWNPHPNRRFCEILIFMCQFFGRAEHVMETSKVRQLWCTLRFVNDFIKALEDQCKEYQAKLQQMKQPKEVTRNDDDTIMKQRDDIAPPPESEQDADAERSMRNMESSQHTNKVIKKRKENSNTLSEEPKKVKAKSTTKKETGQDNDKNRKKRSGVDQVEEKNSSKKGICKINKEKTVNKECWYCSSGKCR